MHVLTALYLALATGTVAYTLTSSKITSPLRKVIGKHSDFLGKLFACPYCLSHWLAFFAVLIYRPWLVHGGGPMDWAVTWAAVTGVAMVPVILAKKATAPSLPPLPPR